MFKHFTFTDVFIRRPVMASAISLFILLLGLFSINSLTLRMFPNIETGVITINTTYTGANNSVIASTITSVIESAIVGIEHVDYITANSTQGLSTVTIHLIPGTDISSIMSDVIEKVSAVQDQLPTDAKTPIIAKQDENQNPIVILAFTSHILNQEQLTDYLVRVIQPKVESIEGVASADIAGATYAMRIWLDPTAMTAYSVTPSDVKKALQAQSLDATPGSLEGRYVTFNITTDTNLDTAEKFDRLVVKNDNDKVVYLRDIGYAQLGKQENSYSAFFNGRPGVPMFITGLSTANPLSISNDVNKLLPDIQRLLPNDVQVQVVMSAATYIKAAIHEVIDTILIAMLIVILVILLSLGSLRLSFIPIITIPLCLIGICFFLLIKHYSINMLTLLAMVLSIGLVVDDAIVVVENIFRYIESGVEPIKAAVQGTQELITPIIAMTITLAAVFAPIGFMGGVTGGLFSEFAFTLAGTVILSGIIALTLSPMLCSKLLTRSLEQSRIVHFIDQVFVKTRLSYEIILTKILSHHYRKIVLIIWGLLVISIFMLYFNIPKELSPQEDYGFLMGMGTAPSVVNNDYLALYSQDLDRSVKTIPEVNNYIRVNGWNGGVVTFLTLTDWHHRKRSSMTLQPVLQSILDQIPGLKFMAIVPSLVPGSQDSADIEFVLTSTLDYKPLTEIADIFQKAVQKTGLFIYLDRDLKYDQPQLHLQVDRDAASILGISMQDITDAIDIMIDNNYTQMFSWMGRSYQVIPQMPRQYRQSTDQLGLISLRTANGELVPLSSVVRAYTSIQPETLNQFNKLNSITISGVIAPHYTTSQAIGVLKKLAAQILPRDVSYSFSGNARTFVAEGKRMLMIFTLALIVIFLILAIQFESYIDPLIVLLGSVPIALLGGLSALYLGGQTINIYTQLGLLTLVGLMSKHGILMTQFANQLREKDNKIKISEAIITAARIRLRPILMTTMAMICSALPLMIVHGAGSESRFAIGLVIASGLLIGTPCTLFLVPIFYLFFKDQPAHKLKIIKNKK